MLIVSFLSRGNALAASRVEVFLSQQFLLDHRAAVTHTSLFRLVSPLFVWSAQPPIDCLYLDGLTELLLSKIKDANCLPGRAFAPRVSTAVQHSWDWVKPKGDTSPPAPGLRRDGTPTWTKWRLDLDEMDGDRGRFDDLASTAGSADCLENGLTSSRMGLRSKAVERVLLAVGGEGAETTPLWGPDEVGGGRASNVLCV